ncbi:DUF3784 domain-containing protein [Lysinibacillus sp. FSL H8-0500]|uniref:DUF3784 domain-containing protein n=1 Tax=Lysinibacillus sp. FSL H8-0500 TaxID=2921393 RepID=UPI00310120E6
MSAFVYFIMMLPFLIFAIVLSQGKGAFLLAGFNTISQKEQEQYDEKALAKFMGKVMYGYCFCLLLCALGELLFIQWLLVIGLSLFVVLTIFVLVYTNTGNRFKE